MDALIDPAFFGALPDEAKLKAAACPPRSRRRTAYEDFLDRARLFGQEQMFLIGARILSGTLSASQAGEAFARLADVLVTRAASCDRGRISPRAHGRLRGQESAILAMGKLGGREMTAASDLDLIIVYDFDEAHPESDGARPLYGGQYFARLTQRIISALTTQTNYGSLYQVDMRLRPSGRSGPLATSIDSFAELPGERGVDLGAHGADARARRLRLAGLPGAGGDADPARCCAGRAMRELVAGDVAEMRRAIATEKGEDKRWDLKYAAGGLIDLEFIAQYLQLVHAAEQPEILDTSTARVLDKAWRLGLIDDRRRPRCCAPAARLYHDLTQILRLCLSGPFDPKSAGAGLLKLLARAADVPTSRPSTRTSPRRRRACARASCGYWARGRRRPCLMQRAADLFGIERAAVARQAHADDRADARRGADAHRAAVQLDQRFGDREAEARALMRLGELAFHLLERTAEVLQGVGRDADAGILDGDHHGLAGGAAAHRDAAAVGGELHGVRQEVEQDLLDRAAVDPEPDAGRDFGVAARASCPARASR